MSNYLPYFCVAMGLFSFTCLSADEGVGVQETTPAVTALESFELQEVIPLTVTEPIVQASAVVAAPAVEAPFSPFTGKVKAKKVRMRVSPDLESRVVKELSKSDFLSVVGQKGDFYAVQPPPGLKAYVFRSFVLDGVVEGNRVNVRLEPSLEAPVIAHLNSGYHIKGVISSLNNKWYEITPPTDAHFYVAKDFVEYIGGPEIKAQLDKRKMAAEQLLDAATLLTKSEMQKSFREMDIERIKHNYETVMSDYAEFSDLADRAKESLATVQEEYLQKKVAFLETKAGHHNEEAPSKMAMSMPPTDRMKLWEPIEESMYFNWAAVNDDRSIDEFYEEQKQSAIAVTGIVEPYAAPVRRKPGDFILREKDLPVAYLYSTQIDLSDYVGKKVTVLVAPRANNNFAFPAYYVLSVE